MALGPPDERAGDFRSTAGFHPLAPDFWEPLVKVGKRRGVVVAMEFAGFSEEFPVKTLEVAAGSSGLLGTAEGPAIPFNTGYPAVDVKRVCLLGFEEATTAETANSGGCRAADAAEEDAEE